MRSQTKTLSRLLLAGILTTLIVPALPAAAAPPGRRPEVRRPDHRNDRHNPRKPDKRKHDTRKLDTRNMVRLGSKRVDGRNDRDTIRVDKRGKFRAIMLRVTDSPARIHDVVVRFENGETFRPRIRHDYRKGSFSQVIDLPGRARDIDQVTFRYSDLRGGQKAEVVLFGIR